MITHVVPRLLRVFTFVVPSLRQLPFIGRAEAVSRSRLFDRRAAREARETWTPLSTPVRSKVGAIDRTPDRPS
jgi:hypothetical protein